MKRDKTKEQSTEEPGLLHREITAPGQEKARSKQTEKTPLQSEEFSSILLNSYPNPILVINPDASIRYVNPALKELTGFSSGELVGAKPPYPWWTEETLLKTTEDLKEAMHRGSQKLEELFQKKNGERFWVEITATPVVHSGEFKYHLASWMDITERKKAEEQLKHFFTDLSETISRAMELRDPYTAHHERRVAILTRLVAARMGLDEERLRWIYIGALLHDIGKISIPESILSKTGKLSNEEWALVRLHSKQGYEILKDSDLPWPVAEMALHHHELLDGSGYPDGLSGNELSLEVRILSVCNIVEAMGSQRPYKAAKNKDQIMQEIKSGRGTKYDAAVVDIITEIIEKGEFEPQQKRPG